MDPIRILILEDIKADAELELREMRETGIPFTSRIADSRATFTKALYEYKPNLVLVDYQLPDFNGMEAIRMVKEVQPLTPVIMVTGALNEETAADSIKAGASDYVVKERLFRLGSAVRSALERKESAEEKRRAETALQDAYRDLERRVEQRTDELSRSNAALREEISERERVEAALKKSEEQYRTLVESVKSVILRVNREGIITFINSFGLELFGYSREELMDRPMLGTLVPEQESGGRDLTRLVEDILARPEQHPLFENENMKKNGERIWIQWAETPIRDKNGAFIELLASGIDITRRKQAEAQLESRVREAEESRRLLTAIIDNVPEGIVVADASREVITAASRYVTEVTGLPKEKMLGMNVGDFDNYIGLSREAGIPLGECILERVIRSGETIINEEHTLNLSGGRMMSIIVNAQPIRDEHDAIVAGVSAWRDITERKQLEGTLRRNEYELRTLVDNSPDLIFRVNRQMQYVYANPAYERLTGILRDRFAGKTNKQLGMSTQMVDFWQSALQSVIESGREHSVEFDMTSFFGKRYFFARLIPEYAKSGLVETVLVIARDITERKRAEEQIRYISFHDEVTGLFNRAFFEEEIRRVDTERDLPISIIMGDVNNLKLVNDVFGHNEGDKLLKAIADSMRKACRQSDIVARWGGDEFAVILPKTDFVTADEICTRVAHMARESTGTVLEPSIALGVATKDTHDRNIYQAVRQAEERMYQNKLDESQENEQSVYDSLLGRVKKHARDMDDHVSRTAQVADTFGRELALSESQMDDLQLLIRLHDIGDAVIPQDILTKPGRLTGQEWEIMKKHAETSFRVVKTFADTARISDEVLAHNERWDGTGYPRGLTGGEIPYLARIFAVIDAYDVMTHPRPYARAFTSREAIEELRRNAGSQFDPQLVEAFILALQAETTTASRQK